MISTNQLKNGNHIDVDGTIFKVLDFQHVKPGKGGAFVRTKLRRASGRQRHRQDLPRRREVPLGPHRDAQDAVPLRRRHRRALHGHRVLRAARDRAGEGRRRAALDQAQRRGRPALHRRRRPATSSCRRPSSSRSPQTEPGLRGDTASGGGDKPATLETGATLRVPLFVNVGDKVKVQTATGDYMSRA